jgi:disulfide bond formation protein DsbB
MARAMTEQSNSSWTLVFAAWLVAALATAGALFFSEIMGFAPCVLCWYQRIFMFPLVVILARGLFPFDPKITRYALPMVAIGVAVAGYHLLLTAGVIPQSMAPCVQGIPCSKVQVEWFGFVTIPLLSFLSFIAIGGLLIAAHFKAPK